MDRILPSDPGVLAPVRPRRLSARAVKHTIKVGQHWRCKCGLEWTVVNVYRSDDEALLAPGRGFCRMVSFKDLGTKYELAQRVQR